MTTTSDLIAETRRHLESYHRTPMNRLASSVTDTTDTLTFEFDIKQIQAGAYIEVGLELMYVWSADSATKTVTVDRGVSGSTAASHSVGARSTANPPFPDFAIFTALNHEIRSLSAPTNGLYAVRSVELSATANSWGYNLPGTSNVQEIISVEARHVGNPRTWTPVTNFRLQHDAEIDDFASGLALHVQDGVRPGQPIRVLYKSGFSALTTLADDVAAVTGIPESALDIPPLGAAMRLVAPREIRRNLGDAQGDSRRADEVPPGATSSSMRGLAALRQQRISEEASLLSQQHPDRGFLPVGPMVW